MHLLPLLNKGVVLSHSAQGEFVHQVNLVGLDQVLVLEGLDNKRESGRVEHDLTLLGEVGEQLFDNGREFWAEKFIGLVHDKGGAFAEVGDTLSCQIENTAWSADNDMNSLTEAHDVVLESGASGRDHHLNAHVFAEGFADLCCLEGEFSCGDEEHGLDLVLLEVDLLERGDHKGGGLACSVFGASEDVSAGECNGYGLFLDG